MERGGLILNVSLEPPFQTRIYFSKEFSTVLAIDHPKEEGSFTMDNLSAHCRSTIPRSIVAKSWGMP